MTTGYRVTWDHPTGGVGVGDVWPDRETAEEVARIMRRGGATDVQITPARQEASDDEFVFTSERVNPDDPMIAGPRWKRERDEARAERDLLRAAFNAMVMFSFDGTPLYRTHKDVGQVMPPRALNAVERVLRGPLTPKDD